MKCNALKSNLSLLMAIAAILACILAQPVFAQDVPQKEYEPVPYTFFLRDRDGRTINVKDREAFLQIKLETLKNSSDQKITFPFDKSQIGSEGNVYEIIEEDGKQKSQPNSKYFANDGCQAILYAPIQANDDLLKGNKVKYSLKFGAVQGSKLQGAAIASGCQDTVVLSVDDAKKIIKESSHSQNHTVKSRSVTIFLNKRFRPWTEWAAVILFFLIANFIAWSAVSTYSSYVLQKTNQVNSSKAKMHFIVLFMLTFAAAAFALICPGIQGKPWPYFYFTLAIFGDLIINVIYWAVVKKQLSSASSY